MVDIEGGTSNYHQTIDYLPLVFIAVATPSQIHDPRGFFKKTQLEFMLNARSMGIFVTSGL